MGGAINAETDNHIGMYSLLGRIKEEWQNSYDFRLAINNELNTVQHSQAQRLAILRSENRIATQRKEFVTCMELYAKKLGISKSATLP